jgi:hypothetical protein
MSASSIRLQTSSDLLFGDFCSLTYGITGYLEQNQCGRARPYLQPEWLRLGEVENFTSSRCLETYLNIDSHEADRGGESRGGCDRRLVMAGRVLVMLK